MPTHSKEGLIQITDDAFAQRLKGNELFKEGDLKGALREYHAVLLCLKGLDSAIQSVFGAPAPEVIITGKEGAEEKDKEKAEEPKEPTLQEKVKQAIGLTYLNSAAIHIKNENFKRALECSDAALKIDENNDKAKFRAAQARIGMGEISKGRAALEDLQKKKPDVAIANALKQLSNDEKARAAQAKSQFKGMYSKKPPAASGEGPAFPPGLDVPAHAAAAVAAAAAADASGEKPSTSTEASKEEAPVVPETKAEGAPSTSGVEGEVPAETLAQA